jgi:hypothetical protein
LLAARPQQAVIPLGWIPRRGPRPNPNNLRLLPLVLLPHRAISEVRVARTGDLGSPPEVVVGPLALPSQSKADIRREGKMHNQHAGLTGVLSEQRMTERQQEAADERLARGARSPRRRRQQATRRWWQLARWPVRA